MLGAPSPWDAHRAESRALVELGDGPDAAEGVAAFLEKRPAGVHRPARGRSSPRWPLPPDDVVPVTVDCDRQPPRPASRARIIASARSATCSLAKIADT